MQDRSKSAKVLVIDDDREFASDLEALLGSAHLVEIASSGESGLAKAASWMPDVVLLDVDLGSGSDGYDILQQLTGAEPAPAVIMLTGDRDVTSVVRAVKLGAFHYVCKPPEVDELRNLIDRGLREAQLRRMVRVLESEVGRLAGAPEFVVGDPQTTGMLRRIDRLAPTGAAVLITGECGTGKEMVARRIHAMGDRPDGPFLGVNCAAIPADLIEAELFGHEKGAFTGADRRHTGKFEIAAGGTLFLDEIGDSPDLFQVKLLRVLEEKCYFRVGGESPIRTDVRILAATSRDVEQEIIDGRFRPELFYRLNVVRIHIGPLRERPGDILPLAYHFLAAATSQYGRTVKGFTPAAEKTLLEHEWPGNVRELRNSIERAVIQAHGDRIGAMDVDLYHMGGAVTAPPSYAEAKARWSLNFKRQYVAAQLRASFGHITRAAELSGVKRQAFQRLMREAGIDAKSYQSRQG